MAYYLLLELSPSGRAVFVGNLNYVMDSLVKLLLIARGNLNAGFT